MEEAINRSEGEKEKWINEAEGKAAEIEALAKATASSLRKLAEALDVEGGGEALALQLAEQYIGELRHLAQDGTEVILPMDLTDLDSMLGTVRTMLERAGEKAPI